MVRLSDLPRATQSGLQQLECPRFERQPFVGGPPLNQRRIALVTTAGLVRHGEKPFQAGAADFRAIPADSAARELLMTHSSVDFDRTGFQRDLNTVLPMDRLNELAARGIVGSVAARHYSFMGDADPGAMEVNARALARILLGDNVFGVILMPVGPLCTRAVSALGWHMEDENMPTVAISLIRMHSERIGNPRTLCVPFELGRPLGAPGDAAFQTRVLTEALSLLEAGPGPVLLRDFPDEAPGAAPDPSWRPEVQLPAVPATSATPARLAAGLHAEWKAVTPWYLRYIEATGRTTAGASGLPIPDCLDLMAAFGCGTPPASPDQAQPAVQVLRFAVDDVKACYLEALLAGGGSPSIGQMQAWFWDTLAGHAIVGLRSVLLASEDKLAQAIGRSGLVPTTRLEQLGLA